MTLEFDRMHAPGPHGMSAYECKTPTMLVFVREPSA
jgi:hypothetical protein